MTSNDGDVLIGQLKQTLCHVTEKPGLPHKPAASVENYDNSSTASFTPDQCCCEILVE